MRYGRTVDTERIGEEKGKGKEEMATKESGRDDTSRRMR